MKKPTGFGEDAKNYAAEECSHGSAFSVVASWPVNSINPIELPVEIKQVADEKIMLTW